jgi:DnaJ-class molecular chaperone
MAIEICRKCKGHGILEYDIGSHKAEYKETKCDVCKGSGREVVLQATKYLPFKPGEARRVF